MLYDDLKTRGLIFQETLDNMGEWLKTPRTFYCGFDPSSDSLHIGSLMPLITMKRMQLAGHKPIVLLGGATGMIGDPPKNRNVIFSLKKSLRKHLWHSPGGQKFIDLKGPQGA